MADIVNKFLKILLFFLLFDSKSAQSHKSAKYPRKYLRNDRSGTSDKRHTGLARDVIADENNYDQLRSWQPYRRDDSGNSVFHNNELPVHSKDGEEDLEHNGNVPVERHRESRIVDRDTRTPIPPAGNVAMTRGTDPVMPPASTLSTALTSRAANVPTRRSNLVPSQDLNVQPTLRSSGHRGAGAGAAYESGAAQPSGNDVPSSMNNQNYNANAEVNEGIRSRTDSAYRPRLQHLSYRDEDLLAQQENELRARYALPVPAPSGDPCLLKPCLNSGVCRKDPDPRGFECICDEGFQGRDCETETLPCDLAGCSTLGFCVMAKQSGLCMCKTQYSVKFCSIKLPAITESVGAKIEEEVKDLTTGDKKYKLIIALSLVVMFCLAAHIYRIAKRRKQLQTEYKRKISDGDYAAEEPPGCFQISNMLCRDFFFCCGTPADDKSKVKDTETAIDVDRRVHNLPGTVKVLPEERIPSSRRLASATYIPSNNRLPSGTHLSSGTHIPASSRLSSKTHLSKTQQSKTHFTPSNQDVSFNAVLSRLNQRGQYNNSRKKEPTKRHKRNSKQNLRKKARTSIVSGIQSKTKRHKREVQDKVTSKTELLSDGLSYSSSVTTSETDESSETARKLYKQPFHGHRFKRYHKKVTPSEGFDSQTNNTDYVRNSSSNIKYPNLYSQKQYYSEPSYKINGFPDIRTRDILEQQSYPQLIPYQNFQTREYHPTRLTLSEPAVRGTIRPTYASYVNTNNNMSEMELEASNDYLETYDETEHTYIKEGDIYNINDGLIEQETYRGGIEMETNLYESGYTEIEKGLYDSERTVMKKDLYDTGHIEMKENLNDSGQYAQRHTDFSSYQRNNHSLNNDSVGDVDTKYDRGAAYSPKDLCATGSQCLHNSQNLIHRLADQYSDRDQMNEFTGYQRNETMLGPYSPASHRNPACPVNANYLYKNNNNAAQDEFNIGSGYYAVSSGLAMLANSVRVPESKTEKYTDELCKPEIEKYLYKKIAREQDELDNEGVHKIVFPGLKIWSNTDDLSESETEMVSDVLSDIESDENNNSECADVTTNMNGNVRDTKEGCDKLTGDTKDTPSECIKSHETDGQMIGYPDADSADLEEKIDKTALGDKSEDGIHPSSS